MDEKSSPQLQFSVQKVIEKPIATRVSYHNLYASPKFMIDKDPKKSLKSHDSFVGYEDNDDSHEPSFDIKVKEMDKADKKSIRI